MLLIDKRIVFCFLIFSMAFIHSIWYLPKFFYFVVYWNLLYKRLAVMSFCDTKFHIFRWRRDYSWCSARVRPRGTKTRRPIRSIHKLHHSDIYELECFAIFQTLFSKAKQGLQFYWFFSALDQKFQKIWTETEVAPG